MTVISYPVPPYSNPPIEPQFYQPGVFFISAISLGQITTITTTVVNNFVIDQQIRIHIPPGYGTRQLNEQTAFVISQPSPTQVVLNINSSKFDMFIAAGLSQRPQIAAIGDESLSFVNNFGAQNSAGYIPGSFINISPV